MVIIRYRFGMDQEVVNQILRPHKQRFPRGKIPGAQARMTQYGERKLLSYRPQLEFRLIHDPSRESHLFLPRT